MTLEEVTAVGAIVGAVGSSIAAIVGVGTWISGSLKERRSRVQTEQAEWTLRLVTLVNNQTSARLEYNMRRPLRMRSIKVIKPRGASIQYYNTTAEPAVATPGRDVNVPRRIVVKPVAKASPFFICKQLLEGRAIDAGTIFLLVYIPERPIWSRSESTRLLIEVKA